MANIGDRITLTMRGPTTVAGTATSDGTASIGASTKISAKGKIVRDLGHSWLVELDDPLWGNNHIKVPKDRVI